MNQNRSTLQDLRGDVNEESNNEEDSHADREILLLKCKSVIQNLHYEIEMLTQDKQESEDREKELEKQLKDAETRLSQGRYQNENDSQELTDLKTKNQMLSQQNYELEQYIIEYRSNEETMVLQLEELTATNKEMQQKIHELTAEITKREHLASEWHQTMRTINYKIEQLDKENRCLNEENESFLQSLEKISPHQPEGDRSTRIKGNAKEWVRERIGNLQHFMRESEKKNQQIEQFQREILNLKSNNLTLQMAIDNSNGKSLKNGSYGINQYDQQLDYPRQILQQQEQYSQQQQRLSNIQQQQQSLSKQQNQSEYGYFSQQQSQQSQEQRQQSPNDDGLTEDDHQTQLVQMELLNELRELRNVQERNKDEVERIQSENIQLKDQLNALNMKLLSAQIDQDEAHSKVAANTLLSPDNYGSQGQIHQLQAANDFLNESLLACKEELAALQHEVQIQFDREDESSIQAAVKLRQLEAAVRERDMVIGELKECYERLRQQQSSQIAAGGGGADGLDYSPRQDTELSRIISFNSKLGNENQMLLKENQQLAANVSTLTAENQQLVQMNGNLTEAAKRENNQRLTDAALIKEQLNQLQNQYYEHFLNCNSQNCNQSNNSNSQIVASNQQVQIQSQSCSQEQILQETIQNKDKPSKKQSAVNSPLPAKGSSSLSSSKSLIKKKKSHKQQSQSSSSSSSVPKRIEQQQQQQQQQQPQSEKEVVVITKKSQNNNQPMVFSANTTLSQKNVDMLEAIRQRESSSVGDRKNTSIEKSENNSIISGKNMTGNQQGNMVQQQKGKIIQPEIVGKFQNAIDRIESKLERMTIELDLGEEK